jgi:hypothetical protein
MEQQLTMMLIVELKRDYDQTTLNIFRVDTRVKVNVEGGPEKSFMLDFIIHVSVWCLFAFLAWEYTICKFHLQKQCELSTQLMIEL